jgi:predicted Fe-Mo cluster-binding NifX family protein
MSNSTAVNSVPDTIRIAIPMNAGAFCEHFGAARQFHFYEGRRRQRLLDCVGRHDAPEHQPGSLPRWLEQQQVDLLVASAIGERALIMLADAGIEVCLADGPRAPDQLAHAALAGRLPRATMLNSRCHGHDHEHTHDCHAH